MTPSWKPVSFGATAAIVGGGASGITAAAAFALGGRELQTIDLFERRNKLLHLQVNSDRYLHPHLYDWPAPDSTRAHAGLPILDWSADEAGAIANKIRTEFREIEARSPNLRVKTQQSVKNVMALGRVGCRVEVERSSVEGGRYDAAVIAIGFGYELETTGENKTYWAPSPLPGALHCELPSGQFPVLFVPGNGDGGLVDFTMASFDRMTHTEITDFVTGYRDLEGTQNALLEIEKQAWLKARAEFDILAAYEGLTLPGHLLLDVCDRLRPETNVWLHTREPLLFRRETSILNRFTAFLAIAADRFERRGLIHLSIDQKIDSPANQGPIKVGSTTITPLHRFLRFGPDRETNLRPFQALSQAYTEAHREDIRGFRPATPILNDSAFRRFGGLSVASAVETRQGERVQPAVESAQAARQKLADVGIERTVTNLALHIRSGNADIVGLFFQAGMPPDTLLDGETPLNVALSLVDTDQEADPARFEVVKAIVAARPRDVAKAAHSALVGQKSQRLIALLRSGVPIDCLDASGQTLATAAMRLDDAAARHSSGWTALLLQQPALPPLPLTTWMLLWAAATGRMSVVERLLELGLPIDSTLHNMVPSEDILEAERAYWWPGGTALHQVLLSAQRSYSFLYEEQNRYGRNIFLLLLRRGASPNVTDACRRTPLHIAAREGLVEATRSILNHCNSFSQRDLDGETALKLAVGSSAETTELLLGSGMPDDPSERADLLHRAVWRRDLRLVERLLKAGCDPNLPNQNCPTALFRLGYFWTTDFDHLRERSVPCLELLLAHGADVSLRDDRGQTVFHPIVLAGDVEAVDCLLTAGADPEACDKLNQTPMMCCGTAAVAQRLLSAGALSTRQDRFGYDALDHAFIATRQDVCDLLRSEAHRPRSAALLVKAIREQDLVLVRELLESGVPVSTTDPFEGPVLHVAAGRQAASVVKVLLERGADINGRDLDGETPLFACLTAPWFGDKFDLQKHEETLCMLLDYGASTDAVNARNEAVLFFGYFWWNFQLVSARILASHQRAYSQSGKTALMMAVERGSEAQVLDLIKNGQADVNASDDQGRTALHWAAGGSRDLKGARYLEKATLLLNSGAQVDAVDRAGETALLYAISAANDAMVDLLLNAGADLTQRNSAGETAEAVALRAANAGLANRLRRKKLALHERLL